MRQASRQVSRASVEPEYAAALIGCVVQEHHGYSLTVALCSESGVVVVLCTAVAPFSSRRSRVLFCFVLFVFFCPLFFCFSPLPSVGRTLLASLTV